MISGDLSERRDTLGEERGQAGFLGIQKLQK